MKILHMYDDATDGHMLGLQDLQSDVVNANRQLISGKALRVIQSPSHSFKVQVVV